MAVLDEVLPSEWDRQEPAEWNKIHLYKMGDFWRAYEWSAWLIAVISFNDEVRMKTKDRKPLHVTRMKRTDADGTYCFVGFPLRSMEKYIPVRENFEGDEDKHVVATIALPEPKDGSKVTFERLGEAVSRWKETIDLSEKKPKKEKPAATAVPAVRTSGAGILAQIMAYPLESRTAVDNVQFISSLKSQITAIL